MTVSSAYSAVPWQTFFAAEVGAGASLTGLLFVAVSINLERILSFPKLPARAGETLTLLLLVVVIASLGLAPQSDRVCPWKSSPARAARPRSCWPYSCGTGRTTQPTPSGGT